MTARRLLAGAFVSAMVVGAAAGAWWWVAGGAIQTTDNAYLRADATIAAPRVEGYLSDVLVQENQPVAKGELLALIDDGKYRAHVEQAIATRDARQAQVAGDRAAIESLKAQEALQKSVIEQSKAGQSAAEAEARRASLNYERYTSLTAMNVSSAQRLESVTSDHLKAEAERRRTAASVVAEEDRLSVLQSDRLKAAARLDQSLAELAEAEAALTLVRLDLDDTRLRAPFDGVVGNLSARVGQYVRPGTSLLTVVPQQPYVVANFKETQVAAMHPGQPATISIDAYPGLTLQARVDSFAPATGSEFSILPPENATGNFTKIVQRVPIRLRIVGPPERLGRVISGVSVVVSVDTSARGCDSDCDTPIRPPPMPGQGSQTSSIIAGQTAHPSTR